MASDHGRAAPVSALRIMLPLILSAPSCPEPAPHLPHSSPLARRSSSRRSSSALAASSSARRSVRCSATRPSGFSHSPLSCSSPWSGSRRTSGSPTRRPRARRSHRVGKKTAIALGVVVFLIIACFQTSNNIAVVPHRSNLCSARHFPLGSSRGDPRDQCHRPGDPLYSSQPLQADRGDHESRWC